jgi:hypothetical protein
MPMNRLQTNSLPQDRFLTLSANLLHRALLEPDRTEARRLFRELQQGRRPLLSEVRMEDRSILRVRLALDHSEVPGQLNFGAFRASVAVLLQRFSERLQSAEPEVPVFLQEGRPEVQLFGLTAVTYEGGAPRVMVLGADTATGGAELLLTLQYLDPSQFQSGEALS